METNCAPLTSEARSADVIRRFVLLYNALFSRTNLHRRRWLRTLRTRGQLVLLLLGRTDFNAVLKDNTQHCVSKLQYRDAFRNRMYLSSRTNFTPRSDKSRRVATTLVHNVSLQSHNSNCNSSLRSIDITCCYCAANYFSPTIILLLTPLYIYIRVVLIFKISRLLRCWFQICCTNHEIILKIKKILRITYRGLYEGLEIRNMSQCVTLEESC